MKRCIALSILLTLCVACYSPPESPSEAGAPPESPCATMQTESARTLNSEPPSKSEPSEDDNGMTSIMITAGGADFSATVYDNDTAAMFITWLPMTLNMSELNSNEKYFYLPDSLPADPEKVEGINTGDLMLYGSDCLVLFYESFTTSYSYTKIGYIDDASGLADALGSGGVEVSFTVSVQ